ncbi:MAG: hypothetical protein FVQ80_06960 [Planctomycetes bacterium]|nr:hypothetical protein [Planctomycetota bacterium]
MKVNVSKDNIKGSVEYLEKIKDFIVSIDDSVISEAIQRYLTTEREFKIPESQKIDDYRIDSAKPAENRTYFELSLNTLYANTGVFVHWDTLVE